MFSTRRILKFLRHGNHRYLSNIADHTNIVTEPLKERGLLRVSGVETHGFLQGLITNDMDHLESGASAIYAMFLNIKGRVMYDTIIYRPVDPHSLLIECDASVLSGLERHLKMYRLRKKISIDFEKNLKVWAVFYPNLISRPGSLMKDVMDRLVGETTTQNEMFKGLANDEECIKFGSVLSHNNIIVYRDPRIVELGLRILCPTSEDIPKLLKVDESTSYRTLRFELGVGEGVVDLPPDHCFPLEANCDYLHGVSFHKGCYIGQELTARTHHTGVVRKRLMPVSLESPVNVNSVSKLNVVCDKQKPVGKVRSLEGKIGIGLLRVSEALSAQSLSLSSSKVYTKKPSWWPKEAPKELQSRAKS